VVARSVLEGQYVNRGEKLFEIADLSKLWFRFEVYEQDLPLIEPGQAVQVSSAALGTNVIEGKIAFIDPNINEATRAARVRVELENPIVGEGRAARRALQNGLYAEGKIIVRTGPVLAVPRTAVIDPGDFRRVYVDNEGGAYELRRVQLGRRGTDYWEVLDGLEEDEAVVTSGNFILDSQAQMNEAAHGATPHKHEAGHEEEE
jgi:membrane fusion protein, copper/silver efflux system